MPVFLQELLCASWIRSTNYTLNFSAGNFTHAEPFPCNFQCWNWAVLSIPKCSYHWHLYISETIIYTKILQWTSVKSFEKYPRQKKQSRNYQMFPKILFKMILKSRLSKTQELHFKQNSSLSSICCPQQFISIYTV